MRSVRTDLTRSLLCFFMISILYTNNTQPTLAQSISFKPTHFKQLQRTTRHLYLLLKEVEAKKTSRTILKKINKTLKKIEEGLRYYYQGQDPKKHRAIIQKTRTLIDRLISEDQLGLFQIYQNSICLRPHWRIKISDHWEKIKEHIQAAKHLQQAISCGASKTLWRRVTRIYQEYGSDEEKKAVIKRLVLLPSYNQRDSKP